MARAIEAGLEGNSPRAVEFSVEGADNDTLVEKWQAAFDPKPQNSSELKALEDTLCPYDFKRVVVVSTSTQAKYEYELNCSTVPGIEKNIQQSPTFHDEVTTVRPESRTQQPDISQSQASQAQRYTSSFGTCQDAGKGKMRNGIYQPTDCEKRLMKLDKKDTKIQEKNKKIQQEFRERVATIKGQFPELDEEQAEICAAGLLFVGMTANMLRTCWPFHPDRVNDTYTEYGLRRQIVYDESEFLHRTYYIYLDNGVVTGWQVEHN
jgi:hypothetical protein